MRFIFNKILTFNYLKQFIFLICFLGASFSNSFQIFAQKSKIDSLINLLPTSKEDSTLVKLYTDIAWAYRLSTPDSSLIYGEKAILLARKIKYKIGEAKALSNMGVALRIKGNYEKALSMYMAALSIGDSLNDDKGISHLYNNIGVIYRTQGLMDKAGEYFRKSLEIKQKIGDEAGIGTAYNNIGEILEEGKNYKEALEHFHKALAIRGKLNDKRGVGVSLNSIGDLYLRIGEIDKALEYFEKSLILKKELNDKEGICVTYHSMSECFRQKNDLKTAMIYASKSLEIAQEMGARLRIMRAYQIMEKIAADSKDFEKAYQYLWLFKSYQDSLYDEKQSMQIVEMQTKFQTNQKEQELLLQKSENQYQKKLLIGVSIGLFSMLILTFLLFYNFRAKKKAKELLEALYFELNEQKEEITVQAEELREANDEILSMNDNLEKTVKERTQQIERQNVQIIGYAFANAHRVRGPLARILGLVNLMKKGIEPSEIPQYVEMLDTSAQEMNEVVKEINEILEEEAKEKWSLSRLKKMLE
jgi:tetratricopeptide (TPR) repeat protein